MLCPCAGREWPKLPRFEVGGGGGGVGSNADPSSSAGEGLETQSPAQPSPAQPGQQRQAALFSHFVCPQLFFAGAFFFFFFFSLRRTLHSRRTFTTAAGSSLDFFSATVVPCQLVCRVPALACVSLPARCAAVGRPWPQKPPVFCATRDAGHDVRAATTPGVSDRTLHTATAPPPPQTLQMKHLRPAR